MYWQFLVLGLGENVPKSHLFTKFSWPCRGAPRMYIANWHPWTNRRGVYMYIGHTFVYNARTNRVWFEELTGLSFRCELNRNVRRDVTALIGWQWSHRCHPVVTQQKRCFYKGQSLTWANIFVVNSNIKDLPGYIKRGHISLPDDISHLKIYCPIKEKI